MTDGDVSRTKAIIFAIYCFIIRDDNVHAIIPKVHITYTITELRMWPSYTGNYKPLRLREWSNFEKSKTNCD